MSNRHLPINILIGLAVALGSLQGQDNESLRPPLILEAKDASVKGPAIFYNSVVRRLIDWQNLSDVASFEASGLPAGEYSLKLMYTAGPESGGRLRLNWNSEIFTGAIRQTGGWAKADEIALGKVKHAGGNVTISLQAARIDRAALMEFVSLTVTQVSAASSPATTPSAPRLTPSPQPKPQPQSNGKQSPPQQEVRLKAQVAMPVMVNGRPSGSITLPAGTFVSLLGTNEAQSKIRWKDMESWVASSALELPEPAPASSTEPDTDSSSRLSSDAPDSPRAVAEWDFSKAEKVGSDITIPNRPDSQGGKLIGKNASWAEIVEKQPTSQGLGVRFLGAPDQRLLSSKELELAEGQNFKIEIEINPSDANDSDRRLLRFANCFELRLRPQKSGIEFIIWQSHQKHANVGANVAFNAWNKIVAEYRGDALELTVNGESVSKPLPTDMKMQAGAAMLSVAYASEGRSFVGSIGRIRWSSEPGAKPDTNPTPSVESERATTPEGDGRPSALAAWLPPHGRSYSEEPREKVRQLAEGGDSEAMFEMGYRLARGHKDGTARDQVEAANWYRRAADHGHVEAQYTMGYITTYGEGVARDRPEGARWFRVAGLKGHREGQLRYGESVLSYRDPEPAASEASAWLTALALDGERLAVYPLLREYDAGRLSIEPAVGKRYEEILGADRQDADEPWIRTYSLLIKPPAGGERSLTENLAEVERRSREADPTHRGIVISTAGLTDAQCATRFELKFSETYVAAVVKFIERSAGIPSGSLSVIRGPQPKPETEPSTEPRNSNAVDSIPITVAGSEVQVIRRGHGPLGIIFFGHSGSDEMVETLLRDEKWFGDLLPDQCSFFLWSYPDAPPFDKVRETISAYGGGDHWVRLPLPGIAESVVSQIRDATGIERFLIVGNSLGAGIVLWDYEKLVGDPSLSFLLISPTEAFLPEVSSIPSLERTMLLAAKGWMNNDGPMRTDSFLRGEEAWDWVAQYRDDDAGDLISDSKSSGTSSNSRREFDMGHKVIGGDINAELLGKLIRVNLGLSPREILADLPKQTE